MRRFFNQQEKKALWIKAAGQCQECGGELRPGWHGDHETPYSQGGETCLLNGSALCPTCNQRKGSRMRGDQVRLRRFQQSWGDAVMTAVKTGQKIVVGNIHPGSGKTMAVLHAAQELQRAGRIDAVQVFVPRVNLCQQFEKDWKDLAPLYAEPRMAQIVWRNAEPLVRGGAFGYVTTYSALMGAEGDEKGNRHERFSSGKRTLLILDEAQQLGVGGDGDSTRSAQVIDRLAARSEMVFVVSGTVRRADGKRILLARYSEPDEKGMIYLVADVEATYKQGVAEGYLRPFEYQLCDGRAIHQYFDGEMEELQLSRMKAGLYRVLESPEFWGPMVDLWVERVREYQRIERSFCGLIGAISQSQAQSVIQYIQRRHQGFKVLIAVSDEILAHDNLRTFRKGGYDGLVTVAMAHVGYDHKPIAVVLALTDVRESGWLDQFFARALRECGKGATMLALVPDDLKMCQYVERKRNESREGLIEREKRKSEGPIERQPPRLGYTTDVQISSRRAVGLEVDTELNPGQLLTVEQWREQYDLKTAPPTALARLARGLGVRIDPVPIAPPAPSSFKTQIEEEAEISRAIEKITGHCDSLMIEAGMSWKRGYANAELKRHFGKARPQASASELREMLRWLGEVYHPYIQSRAGAAQQSDDTDSHE